MPAAQEETALGWREEKKRRTRLELCMAARRLAVEQGIDAMNVDDVARAVGVSPRTFFNYYETKMDAVVGPVGEIGTPESRQEFIAGGPSGVLIDDLTALYASLYEPEDQAREGISLVTQLITSEPRVLAGFIAAGVRHETALAELLSARVGERVDPEFASLAAGVMSALTTRAAMCLATDPNRSLAAALRDQSHLAARLFDRSDDRRKR
ncbi:TetR/AcrR family transcriptional regulator [Nocardia sp. NBC_01503]|uniref:TetR/AcrR family transcriptional regulator n=1 Tax=Nocardia sp. NBC_01503 TaxID=2975997 RepID=UPI002E7B2096|nr:helix-turn-helix domain-containing protein [Nocardia sp. NBC_01503]WTL29191.1 TetR/AcrR family transcriptional regulator [Nocardia sp. NBC_01503]